MGKIIIVILIVFILLILFFSNYLVTFAVKRKKKFDQDIIPKEEREQAEVNTKRREIIKRNLDDINKETKEWLEIVDIDKLEIKTYDDITLKGNIYRADSNNWIILLHGYMGKKEDVIGIAGRYNRLGYNVLLPDLRAHGESEGEYIGMGWLDRKDMLYWIDKIIEIDKNANIVLHGISMGAATVMMTSGEELAENVKAIVEDCGYTSVWDIFEYILKSLFHLPAFPILYISKFFGKIRAGYSFKASSLDQMKKSNIPIMFIHGADDKFVHTDMQDICYKAKPGEKDYLRIEDAGHGEAFLREPELYFNKIEDFIEKYI